MRGGVAVGLLMLVASVAPAATDEEVEQFLLNATIVDVKRLGLGKSGAMRVTLEQNGETRSAVFKTIDIHERGYTAFREDAPPELNFTDSYKYEPAAYRLDRQLGFEMAPVSVIRKVKGRTGALIEWISDAIDEQERLERDLRPEPPGRLDEMRSLRQVFDALIGNIDRNMGNILYTVADWELHLIDHSRTFRHSNDLPEEFLSRPVSVLRELLPKLEALNRKDLEKLFGRLVSDAQVRALLIRRDRILEKIRQDRERLGDDVVFLNP